MTQSPFPHSPRYTIDQAVQIDDRHAVGHCRSPKYLRGQIGQVVSVHGCFRDPERLAYHRPGLPARILYKVRFRQCDLWPDYRGDEHDELEADIYENWLVPVMEHSNA